jgi:hypothetical protein
LLRTSTRVSRAGISGTGVSRAGISGTGIGSTGVSRARIGGTGINLFLRTVVSGRTTTGYRACRQYTRDRDRTKVMKPHLIFLNEVK